MLNKRKIFLFGIICIFLSLISIAIRGFVGDMFFASKIKKYMVPAGEIISINENNFNFAIISDSGSRNESLQNIINNIRNSDKNYKFILHLGDFVNDQPMQHFYWLLGEIAPKLKDIPFYIVPGNHDVFANTKTNRFFYETVFGYGYYYFSYGDVLFIGLDSSERTIGDKQLEWLQNVLLKIRPLYKSCIIFSHVPPTENDWKDKNALKKFENILLNNKIDVMFFGHIHEFSTGKFANIPYYTNLASGQTPRGDIKKFGYLSANIEENQVKNVEPIYTDYKKEKEELDIFFIDHFLTKKNRVISFSLLLIGLICVIYGCNDKNNL